MLALQSSKQDGLTSKVKVFVFRMSPPALAAEYSAAAAIADLLLPVLDGSACRAATPEAPLISIGTVRYTSHWGDPSMIKFCACMRQIHQWIVHC